MAKRELGKQRVYLHISSSIKNFELKLLNQTGLLPYHPIKNLFSPVVFFGMYHPVDYLRALLHIGRTKIFWCGGDIVALQSSPWRWMLNRVWATHYCENTIEAKALDEVGITARIRPMIFDSPKFPISFERTDRPHVYMTAHEGREVEYGIRTIKQLAPFFPNITFHIYGITGYGAENVTYHGDVSEKQFNSDISKYHAAIRLNEFDGFAETLAKSALMGQYPISVIPYHYITCVPDEKSLRAALEELPKKTHPNLAARMFWMKTLEVNLAEVIC